MKTDNMTGLTDREVLESREKHGVNILTPPEKASVWSQFLEKFNDPLIKILLVALCLSVGIASYEAFGLGEGMHAFFEPIGILIAILLATVISFALELNANKKFEMLNQVNDDIPVTVMRNGNMTQVPRKDIVVGDIVMLETGNEVPADGTLLETVSLSINESTLTGEPVIKKTHIPEEFSKDATYPSNKAMRGTTVTDGHGVMRVEAVGDATEYGKVYVAAQIDNGVKTPLTLQFERLGRLVSYASYTIGALILIGRMLIYDYSVAFDAIHFIDYTLTTIMLAVTLVVVSVPEGLPMSVTLSLALSMRRMLATNNLVRKMHACETMGATTVICTDKTGTLTQNQMRIYQTQFSELGESQLLGDDTTGKTIAEAIAVNSTAFLDHSGEKATVLGNPTEGALLLWMDEQKIDYMPLREGAKVVEQLPFSTMRKYMATVVDSPVQGKRVLYVKGAPEIVMEMCRNFKNGVTKEGLKEQLLAYQQKAMRTLGFAYQVVDGKAIADDKVVADNLTFMGIVAISDPVRADVPDAIKESLNAGIKIKIVTGDTPGTAKEIGRQIGLWNDVVDTDENHISGPDFAALSDEDAAKAALKIKIMSRARPTDKSRLVSLLQQQGEVVAVTGDGTNDAPALNAAQVGLSMGDGTSVAKEASDITIMDNSFASITRAVMWGRSLYQNIQRFILFQLTVNLVACMIVLIGAFTGQDSPLTVTQMLWVNLIMDTFAALSLASLPPSMEVMKNKPRKMTDFIINRPMKWFIIGVSAVFVFVLFGFLQYLKYSPETELSAFTLSEFFANYFKFDPVHASVSPYDLTVFFTFFVFLQFWNLFNAKSFESGHSSFQKIRESKVFFMTILVILVGQVLIVTFGGQMFSVVPLKWQDWLILFGASSVVLWLGEIVHFIHRCTNKSK